MIRRPWGRGWAAGVAALVVALGCGGKHDHVAKLIEAAQAVDRAEAAKPGAWRGAAVGDRFNLGDAVRTGPTASARLELAGGGRLRMGKSTVIRFAASASGQAPFQLGVDTGEAEIEAGDGGARFEAGGRVTKMQKGSRLRIAAGDAGLRFDVIVGSAELEGGGEDPVALGSGQGIVIAVGGAVLEPPPDAAPPPVDPTQVVTATVKGRNVKLRPTEAEPWKGLPAGASPVPAGGRLRLPRGAQVELARGAEVASVAGPAELVVGAPGEPLLATEGGSVALTATASVVRVAVPGGVISARARPGSGSRAEVQVKKRGGTNVKAVRGAVEVKGKAGAEVIEAGEAALLGADGSVEVMGRGPARADFSIRAGESPTVHDPRPPTAIRIRFGEACPGDGVVEMAQGGNFGRSGVTVRGAGGAFTLHVAGEKGKPRVVSSAQESHTFASGDLGEGTYRWWWEAGSSRSPDTTLRIGFDNAAPTAYIKEPADKSAWGAAVHLAGAALIGSSVSVGGTPLPLDGAQRFDASVSPPSDEDAIAVRIAHPEHGVHYYLRRGAGK